MVIGTVNLYISYYNNTINISHRYPAPAKIHPHNHLTHRKGREERKDIVALTLCSFFAAQYISIYIF